MTTALARHPDQPKRYRVMFRHIGETNGLSANTYTFSDAYAMIAKWSPLIQAKVSLVPA